MSLSAPTYAPSTIVGLALAEALSPWLTVDLAAYADAIGAMFQPVDALIQQTDVDGTPDYVPPYGTIFDPMTCPSYALPYLAQYVGVTITPGASDSQARSQIISEQGMHRGTSAAIIAAAKAWLSGTQTVQLLERQRSDGSKSAYSFVVVVLASELATGPTWLTIPGTYAATTDVWDTGDFTNGLTASVNAAKPAGTVWELVSTSGSDVSLTPTGPSSPTGGWTVVMADGASLAGPAPGDAGSFFGPNRDPRSDPRPSINPVNGDALYYNSQVKVTSGGYQFTAIPGQTGQGTTGQGDPIAIKTGYMSSAFVNAQGGAPGWPGITGFMWNPVGQSSKTVFEWVITTPAISSGAGTYGMDVAMWFSDPVGHVEFDMPEMDAVGGTATGGAFYSVINHDTSTETQFAEYDATLAAAYMFPGGTHTYTCMVDSVAQTMDAWVDGVHQSDGSPISWPSALTTNLMAMNIIFDWRTDVAVSGNGPTFTTPLTMTVRSVAVYQDTPHAGEGIAGGGVQTGTNLV